VRLRLKLKTWIARGFQQEAVVCKPENTFPMAYVAIYICSTTKSLSH
jgi:hypothetical protein